VRSGSCVQLSAVQPAAHYEAAVNTFTQVITIAGPDQPYEEAWQSIRWNAYQQMGNVFNWLNWGRQTGKSNQKQVTASYRRKIRR
jgi:hypothetical protein